MSFLKGIKGFFLKGIILSILIIEPVQANWFTDAFKKIGDAVTTVVQKVDQTVTTVVHKIAPLLLGTFMIRFIMLLIQSKLKKIYWHVLTMKQKKYQTPLSIKRL